MPFLGSLFAAASSFFTSSFVGKLLGQVLVKVGLSAISNALNKTEEPPSGVSLEMEYGERTPRYVRCGRYAVVGHFTFPNTYGPSNSTLQHVYKVSDYPVTSLESVWIDGEKVTLGAVDPEKGAIVSDGKYAGLIWVKLFDGTQTGSAVGLVNNSNPVGRWTSDHIGAGIAYIVVTAQFDREKLTSPPQFLFELMGAPVYDFRKDDTVGGSGSHRWNDPTTHEVSTNPIVIAYHYYRGFEINGDVFCGMEVDEIDLPLSEWAVAANICDEIVDGLPRYECALTFDCTKQHRVNIAAALQSCGGNIVDAVEGIWPIVAAELPVIATFTDEDLQPDAPVQFQKLSATDEIINSVSGTYFDPDNVWAQTGYEVVSDASLLALDRRSRDDVQNYDGIFREQQANQLASIKLNESRFSATANITLLPTFKHLRAGQWITWNSNQSVRSRTYQIMSKNLAGLDSDTPRAVQLSLRERDASAYSNTVVAVPIIPLLPGAPVYATELINFTVTPAVGVGDASQVMPMLRLNWSAPTDITIIGIEFEWRLKADVTQVFDKFIDVDKTTTILREGIVSNSLYEVRHKLVSDPPRSFSWAAWVEVVSPDTPNTDVNVTLDNAASDVHETFQSLRGDFDGVLRRLQDLAEAHQLAEASEFHRVTRFAAQTKESFAAVTETINVITAENEAFAEQITELIAQSGDEVAGGLMKFEAQAGSGDVAVSFSILVRASLDNEDFIQSGLVIEAYNDGGTLKSRVAIQSNQFVVTDGTNNSSPLVFENSEMVLRVARIGTAYFDQLSSDDGKLVITGGSTAGIEIFS